MNQFALERGEEALAFFRRTSGLDKLDHLSPKLRRIGGSATRHEAPQNLNSKVSIRPGQLQLQSDSEGAPQGVPFLLLSTWSSLPAGNRPQMARFVNQHSCISDNFEHESPLTDARNGHTIDDREGVAMILRLQEWLETALTKWHSLRARMDLS